MTAHRYWRLLITDTSTTGGAPAIAELQMAESPFGANVCSGGTASASSTAGTTTAAGAFNGTFYTDNGAALWAASVVASTTAQWIKYDFGTAFAKDIKSVRILARQTEAGGGPATSPANFTVQSSDDDSTWTTEWTVSGSTGWVEYELRHFHKTTPHYTGAAHGSHTYWRIAPVQGAAAAYAGCELQLRTSPGGSQAASGGTSTAWQSFGGAPGTFDSTKLFDNNTATLWSSTDKTNPAWVQYLFASAVSLAEFVWQARNDSNANQSPSRMLVLWSDDGSAWNLAWSAAAASWTTLGQTQTFTDPNWSSVLAADIADALTGQLTATLRVIDPCVWDAGHLGSHAALSNANLTVAPTTAAGGATVGTIGRSSGKKYWELTISDISNLNQFQNWGVAELSGIDLEGPHVDGASYPGCVRYGIYGGGGTWDIGATTLGFALDFSTGHMTVYINCATISGILTTVPNAISFGHTVYPFAYAKGGGTSDNITANFGASAFTIGMPAGYASWDGWQGDDSATPAPPTSTIGFANVDLTVSAGRLIATTNSTNACGLVGGDAQYSGKFYFEAKFTVCAGVDGVGVVGAAGSIPNFGSGNYGYFNNGNARDYQNNGFSAGPSYVANDWIGVAVDLDNSKIWFRKNGGSWNGTTDNPATNTGGISISPIVGLGIFPWINFLGGHVADSVTINFGASAFNAAAPTGFSPWYQNPSLQYDKGVVATADTGSPGSSVTSGNMNTLRASVIIVDVTLRDSNLGHSTAPITITDTAGLTWTKRQDVFDTTIVNRFLRFWAYSPAPLSGWNFTVTWGANVPGQANASAISYSHVDYVTPFDDAIGLPTYDQFVAASSTMTTTAATPNAQEIISLSSIFWGGSVSTPTLSAGGVEFLFTGQSTDTREQSAGKYYATGVAAKTFSYTPHTGDSYGIVTDALRLNAQSGLPPAAITDDGGLSATITAPTMPAATFADDNGLSATITITAAVELSAAIRDDLGLTATLTEINPPPPIQQVIICT